MWLADQWKDYEVLDTSNGEKLERWGDYFLVRPDPQVLSVTAAASVNKIESAQDIQTWFTGYGLEVDGASITADKVMFLRLSVHVAS